MAKQLISRIQLRRDTAANWKTNNTTLSKGEIALSYDVNADGVALPNSYRVKIGDGTTKWNSLDYFAQRVLVGSGAPAASLGENGQFYVDTTNKYLYFKNNDAWITIGGDISGELDKKLDKNTTANYSVYGVASTGDQVMFPITGGHDKIVGVGGDGKIPVGLLPDVVLGNVLYGGNLTDAPTDANTWAATPSASLKTRLGIAAAVTSITIKNQEGGASTTGYGWKALEGVYFIANAAGTFAGISFEVGDWLISTGDSWQKVDNTDTIKTVGGVAPVNGNVAVEGVKGVSVTGADSKLSIGLNLANETQLTGSATTIAESGSQISAVRLDKDGKLGVVIPKGVEYTGTENQIQITDNKIGLTSTAKTDIFRTNDLEVAGKGSQFSQLVQNGIGQFNTTGGVTEYSLLNYQGLMHGKTGESTTTGGYSVIILPPIPASGSNQFAMPEVENTTGERVVVDLVGAQTNNKFTGKNAFTQPIIFGPSAATAIDDRTLAASLKYIEDGDGKIVLGKGWIDKGATSTGTYYTFSKNDDKTHEVATLDDVPKYMQGRNIEITGTTIQTTKELDAEKIFNSTGSLTVGSGANAVEIQASGISLAGTNAVTINSDLATINAPTKTPEGLTVGNGMSVTGDVAMADSLSVSGAITTASNNPATTELKEVVVDTDYVIIDGGDSTTTW